MCGMHACIVNLPPFGKYSSLLVLLQMTVEHHMNGGRGCEGGNMNAKKNPTLWYSGKFFEFGVDNLVDLVLNSPVITIDSI